MNKYALLILIPFLALLFFGCAKTQTIQEKATNKHQAKELSITSPVFAEMDRLDKKYSCDGDNVNPELRISGYPPQTKTLVILVDDPDAKNKPFTHWVVFNIEPTGRILENSVPGKQGRNDYNKNRYDGPCPPEGEHRYRFKVYALDISLDLPGTATSIDVEKAMDGHIFAKGELTARYRRQQN